MPTQSVSPWSATSSPSRRPPRHPPAARRARAGRRSDRRRGPRRRTAGRRVPGRRRCARPRRPRRRAPPRRARPPRSAPARRSLGGRRTPAGNSHGGQRDLRAAAEREAHARDARGDDPADEVGPVARAHHHESVLAVGIAEPAAARVVVDVDARQRPDPVRLVRRRVDPRLRVRLDAVVVLAEHRRQVVVEVDVSGRAAVDAEQRAVRRVEAHEGRLRRRGDQHEARREAARRERPMARPAPARVLDLGHPHRGRDRRGVVVEPDVGEDPQAPVRRARDPAALLPLVVPRAPQREAQPLAALARLQRELADLRHRPRRGLRRRAADEHEDDHE